MSLLAAGVLAGCLTTVAGLGGGVLLVALLSLFWTPAFVLATTTPALFIGNASRAAILRDALDWGVLWRFCLTGVPAGFLASLAATSLPADAVKLAIALLLVALVVHEGRARPADSAADDAPHAPPAGAGWWAAVAGAIAGVVSGLTGGAGFVSTPLLERLRLTPTALVATSSAGMGMVHLAKGVGFTAAAVLTPAAAPAAAALAVGVVVGNALGARVLRKLSREAFKRIMLGALALAAGWLLLDVIHHGTIFRGG